MKPTLRVIANDDKPQKTEPTFTDDEYETAWCAHQIVLQCDDVARAAIEGTIKYVHFVVLAADGNVGLADAGSSTPLESVAMASLHQMLVQELEFGDAEG